MDEARLARRPDPADLPGTLPGPGEGRLPVGRGVVDHVQGDIPAQAHRGPVVVGPVGLRDDDVVARLLDLDERDPRAEVMGHAGVRHVHLTGPDLGPMERVPDRRLVVAAGGRPERRPVDAGPEADARVGRLAPVARGLEEDPRFGLAVRRVQVAARPLPGRMRMERDLARRRQELDEDPADGSPALGERRPDHRFRRGLDDLLQRERAETGDVDAAQALRPAIGIPVVGQGARPHPVLGPPVGRAVGQAAEGPRQPTALVEPVERVVGEGQRATDGRLDRRLPIHLAVPARRPAQAGTGWSRSTRASNSAIAGAPSSAPISRSYWRVSPVSRYWSSPRFWASQRPASRFVLGSRAIA